MQPEGTSCVFQKNDAMFSPWSNRVWATLSRQEKKKKKNLFWGVVGLRGALKKGYTIFFSWMFSFQRNISKTTIITDIIKMYLKVQSFDYEVLEGLMLKLKLQYSSHLMQRANSLEKTRMLGKIEGRRRRGQQRMSWLDRVWANSIQPIQWTWVWANSRRQWSTGKTGMLQSMWSQRIRHSLVTNNNITRK